MLSTRVLFLVIFVSTVVNSTSQNADQKHCYPDPSKKGGLRFTELGGPATLAIGCATQMTDLVCCTSNFKTITWFHTTDGGTTWSQIKTDDRRNLNEQNQVASIFAIDPWADRGSYKCVAEGFKSGERIENTVDLDIRNCSSWNKPPIWLYPRKEVLTVKANVGDNIIIPCKTFSGTNCEEDDFCTSFWFKLPYGQLPQNNSSARINYDYTCRPEILEIESILTINGVTEEDFGRYNCTAINSNDQNAPDRLVILEKDDPIPVVVLVNVAIAGGVLLSLAVVVILVTYQRRADLDFKIWMSRRQLGDETSRVLLINAVEDKQFAAHLKNILETNLQFAVTSSCDDVLGNEASVTRIPALADECDCVLVLLTPALLEDGVLLAAIRDIIHQVIPVFVADGIADMGACSDRPGRDEEFGENLKVALSVSRPLYWPGVNNDGPPGGKMEDRNPSEDWERRTTERQATVFWKKLQLSLLKKTRGRSRRSRVRLDSTQPLLL